ncbi:MAG: VCBS repeat-containing protein [Planctomycetes bacterium]|nr:VCBS repeat-containing protein [Planctomycetota bacterium]
MEGKHGRAERLDPKVLADSGIALPEKPARVVRGTTYERQEADEAWAFDFDGLGELELAVLRKITDKHPRPEEDDDWEPYENKHLVVLEKRSGAWVVIHEHLRACKQCVHLGFYDFDGDGDSEIAEEVDGVRGNLYMRIWFRAGNGAVMESDSLEGAAFACADVDGNGAMEILRYPADGRGQPLEVFRFREAPVDPENWHFRPGRLEAASGAFTDSRACWGKIRARAAETLLALEKLERKPASDLALYRADVAREVLAKCDEILGMREAKGPGE